MTTFTIKDAELDLHHSDQLLSWSLFYFICISYFWPLDPLLHFLQCLFSPVFFRISCCFLWFWYLIVYEIFNKNCKYSMKMYIVMIFFLHTALYYVIRHKILDWVVSLLNSSVFSCAPKKIHLFIKYRKCILSGY